MQDIIVTMKAAEKAVLIVGFSSMVAQLALLRQSLVLYQGNELMLGLALGSWMLLVGAGTYIGGRIDESYSRRIIAWTLVASALILPMMPGMFAWFGRAMTVRGEVTGPIQAIATTLISWSAFCMLYGLQLTVLCNILGKHRGGWNLSRGYMLDTAGSALAGAIFTLILVGRVDNATIFYIASYGYLLAALAYSRKMIGSALIAGAILSAFALGFDMQALTESIVYPGQNIVAYADTRYGSIVVSEDMGQYNFFENGVPVFSTNDVAQAEEKTHYAMLQRDNPKKVLLIGGGASGSVKEILKYNVTEVDYVEIDSSVIDLARRYVPLSGLDDRRVHLIYGDGRRFVKTAGCCYDVVIVDLPQPTNAQTNRYYTLEFFADVKKIISDDGVFSESLNSGADYIGQSAVVLNRDLHRTLKGAFGNVIVLPGLRSYYLASDGNLTYDIAGRVRASGLNNTYVNGYYLGGILTGERIGYLNGAVSAGGEVNRDLRPTGYYTYLIHWLERLGIDINPAYIAALIGVIFLLTFFMMRPIGASVFCAGFTSSALEVVLLVSFQEVYGYLYEQVGLIVSAFMVGLAAGAYLVARGGSWGLREVQRALLGTTLFCLMLPPTIVFAAGIKPPGDAIFAMLTYPVLAAILGALSGLTFTIVGGLMGGRKEGWKNTGVLFSIDYLGALIGSVISSVILIPLIGLINLCILSAALNSIAWIRLKSS